MSPGATGTSRRRSHTPEMHTLPEDAARILALPELVINQIAAGEVVERPASVVKELVENALDAGATEVRVDLEEGGVKLVRVVDDGIGMGPEDLRLAFLPHATSKLRSVEDLDHIGSLGFRGEALASIGSVSRARIVSRPTGFDSGWEIRDDGGRIGEVRDAASPRGTTIEIRDLFFNTPARRRFLKRTSTELGRCLDVLQRIALAHVGVGFVVTHDGARVFDVERGMNLRERVHRLFGAELASSLVPVGGEDGDTRLGGFLAPPRFSRRDTSRQMWFLNGRPLRDRILSRVLKEGYRGYLVEGRQPVAFLTLSMDPGKVDVNVHPTKSEVRFREERRLFGFLVNRLREAVAQADIATPGDKLLDSARRRGAWNPRDDAPGQAKLPDPGVLRPAPRPAGGYGAEGGPSVPQVREVPGRPFGTEAGDRPFAPQAESASPPSEGDAWGERDEFQGPFLQVARTYIVRALPDGFEVIDQHAFHERVTYEGLREQFRRGSVEVQRRLVPELVEVSRSEVELLTPHLEELRRIGVELDVFGPATLAVHGLPALLRNPDPEGVVRDVIAVVEKTGRTPTAEDVVEEVLHSAACRSSIMAGDELDESSIRALLERAAELENDQTCPHSRPTRVRFDLSDLEKAFHRR